MTLDKNFCFGKMEYTHLKTEGPEYESMNMKPMFRYNTYFGINTVYYFDLIETTENKKLPIASITLAAILTKLSKGSAAQNNKESILNPFSQNLFDNLNSLKFLSYIGEDGFPVLIPVIQCQASDSKSLAFSLAAFGDALKKIPGNADIAIFGMTLDMEDVLTRGKFRGIKRYRGVKLGVMDINWVYNSLPPLQGQIYPEVELKPVTEFE